MATLSPLIESMKITCDDFAVYGSKDDPTYHMEKVYNAKDWHRHFNNYFSEIMEVVIQILRA